MNSLFYNWNITSGGVYNIQATYSNGIVLSDNKTVIVTLPLQITSLSNVSPAGSNPLIVWGSTPGVNYQVLVTTNLTQPFQPSARLLPQTDSPPPCTTRRRPRRRNFTRLKSCLEGTACCHKAKTLLRIRMAISIFTCLAVRFGQAQMALAGGIYESLQTQKRRGGHADRAGFQY